MDDGAKAWLAEHEDQLPQMSRGQRRMRYVGGSTELALIENPRKGSDVYIVGEFLIATIDTKQSEVPGAPTMPVQQWLRYRKPKDLFSRFR
jgi:hypothetical protein